MTLYCFLTFSVGIIHTTTETSRALSLTPWSGLLLLGILMSVTIGMVAWDWIEDSSDED